MKDISSALEATSMVLAGLAMSLLVVGGVVSSILIVSESRQVASEFIGNAPKLSLSVDEVAAVNSRFIDTSGQVAGAVDDSSVSEDTLRNKATAWLIDARESSGLDLAYRDGVLDRRAQSHAKTLAASCSDSTYNDWQDTIGVRVDNGYVWSFGESIFGLNGPEFTNQLPQKTTDYQRLFGDIRAFGVGIAETDQTCGMAHVLTFHLADVQ